MKKKIMYILLFITILVFVTLGIFILNYNKTIISLGGSINFSSFGVNSLMLAYDLDGSIDSSSRVYFIIEVHGITQEDFKQKYEILSIELNGRSQEYSFESTHQKNFKIRMDIKRII